MGYGRFVGRVGALALALGVGALAPAVASADPGDSGADAGGGAGASATHLSSAAPDGAGTAGKHAERSGLPDGTPPGVAAPADEMTDDTPSAESLPPLHDSPAVVVHDSGNARPGQNPSDDTDRPEVDASDVEDTASGDEADEPDGDHEGLALHRGGANESGAPSNSRPERAGPSRRDADEQTGRANQPEPSLLSRVAHPPSGDVRAEDIQARDAVLAAAAPSTPEPLVDVPAPADPHPETLVETPVYQSVLQAFGLLPFGPDAPIGEPVFESLWALYRRAEFPTVAQAAPAAAQAADVVALSMSSSAEADAARAGGPVVSAAAPAANVDPLSWFQHTFFNTAPTFAPQSPGLTLAKSQTSQPIALGGIDADGDALTYTISGANAGTGSSGGTLTIAGGTATYTPPSSWNGQTAYTETFTVTASEGGFHIHGLPGLIHVLTFGLLGDAGDTASATITVRVAPTGSEPPPEPPPGPPPPPPSSGMNAVDAAAAGKLVTSTAGPITDAALKEISGIDAGVVNPDVYWVHNDSGDSARVFAIDADTGQLLRTYTLSGAKASDWEDMEIGAGPVKGQPYLYLGDIGDNGLSRAEIVVYRVPEPVVTGSGTATLTGVDALHFTYPDGAHNAEALMVDPNTGDLVIIEKVSSGDPRVYWAPAANLANGSVTTLQQVGTLDMSNADSNLVTSADISADGKQIAVRTYRDVLLWNRDPNASVWSVFTKAPATGPNPSEQQGEAIAFHPDGRGYVTVSEGSNQLLHNAAAP